MKKRKWSAEEVRQWYFLNNTNFYSNKEDGNIVVRKPKSLGWTVNWANPWAYAMQGAVLAVVFTIIYLLGA